MAYHLSTAVRNASLDAIETTIGTSAVLKVRTGTQPANCAAADTGTVLVTANLPSDWMAAASGGSKAMAGTWQDLSADNSGFAGHYRIYASDGTTCHAQGPCAMSWLPSPATFAVGHRVVNGANIYVCTTAGTPASSGGPTGTGTGITDGGCVWDYVETATGTLLAINTNLAAGQPFTVSAYTLTAGNA